MNNGTLTAEQLFLRYAYPCAEGMLDSKKINIEHYNELERLIDQNEQPRRKLLKYCFSKAFNSLRRSASEKSKSGGQVWNMEIVRWHWREQHNLDHYNDCSVQKAVVNRFEDCKIVIVMIGKHTTYTINHYGLQLKKDDVVFIHRNVIIELDDKF